MTWNPDRERAQALFEAPTLRVRFAKPLVQWRLLHALMEACLHVGALDQQWSSPVDLLRCVLSERRDATRLLMTDVVVQRHRLPDGGGYATSVLLGVAHPIYVTRLALGRYGAHQHEDALPLLVSWAEAVEGLDGDEQAIDLTDALDWVRLARSRRLGHGGSGAFQTLETLCGRLGAGFIAWLVHRFGSQPQHAELARDRQFRECVIFPWGVKIPRP